MSWHPLLSETTRGNATNAVKKVAADLEASIDTIEDLSVAQGLSGIMIFFSECYAFFQEQPFADLTHRVATKIFNQFEKKPLPPWLYHGYSGIAWAFTKVRHTLQITGIDEDITREIDHEIASLLRAPAWPYNYDLIGGLVGLGVYGLSHPNSDIGLHLYAATLEHLLILSDRESNSIFWRTPPRLMSPQDRAQFPNGVRNLGLAHGMPGIIALLAFGIGRSWEPIKSTSTLLALVSWFEKQRRSSPTGSRYAYFAEEDVDSRCAWCYGDVGIAVAMFNASMVLGNGELRSCAIDIASDAGNRSLSDHRLDEHTLCHGTSGLLHIYNHLFQSSNAEVFRNIAMHWFTATLSYVETLDDAHAQNDSKYRKGILSGAAGVGLSLLAAMSDIRPEWDQLLLISDPHLHDNTA